MLMGTSESAVLVRLRRRLLGRPRSASAKLWAWLGPLIAMLFGGILRFWELGRPHQLIFDETYYVKQGWSLVRFGYERAKPTDVPAPDAFFTHNQAASAYGESADFVVHPPFGKWMIGWGEQLFGINSSFGWRFSVALLGTLAILLVGRAAWLLFRSATLATVAALLLAVEGMAFVHARVGILDGLVMFWALAGFVAILADRERTRGLLAEKVAALRARGQWGEFSAARRFGPSLGWRPWRWVAAMCLGLGLATKWSDGFYLAVFGLMSVAWDWGARRTVGVRYPFWGAAFKDAISGAAIMVPTAVGVYVATWWGWFASQDAWGRNWAADHPAVQPFGLAADSRLWAWMPDSLRSLWDYHLGMFKSAKSITSAHTYESNPWTWMLQVRPTSYFYEGPKRGVEGCLVDTCSKAITSLGNPLIWWAATVGLLVLVATWLWRRDWRAGAILGAIAAGWLPWFMYQERTIFTFYAVVFAPYVVLTVTYLLGLLLGRDDATLLRRRVGILGVGLSVMLAIAAFAFFWPIYTAQVIPYEWWRWRMWLPSWI